jgi:SlyX protein
MTNSPARSREASALNDETLEQIQTKIAFLERAAAELSDVVFRQQREIQTLEAKFKALAERLSGTQSDDSTRLTEHERPPHY